MEIESAEWVAVLLFYSKQLVTCKNLPLHLQHVAV